MQSEILSNFVQVDGLNIHYLSAGEGKPVVLVHGWPTSSYLWRNIIPPLAKRMKVIAPDLPGFGKSDKPLDAVYSHNYHVRFLHDFLNKLNIGKVSIVLHDVGVPIGLLWAIRNPDKILKYEIYGFDKLLWQLIGRKIHHWASLKQLKTVKALAEGKIQGEKEK